jgi:putative transposase
MPKFRNKYRIESARLVGYDYGSEGAYFITICTHDRLNHFGQITSGQMHLNQLGIIAHRLWSEIPEKFPFALLGAFVIMPNHVHGIVIIHTQQQQLPVHQSDEDIGTDEIKQHQQPRGGITGEHNPMLVLNISRIIRWYTGRCSFEMHKINPDFRWQKRFYDHIIRNHDSFQRIEKYILENPKKWAEDKFYFE